MKFRLIKATFQHQKTKDLLVHGKSLILMLCNCPCSWHCVKKLFLTLFCFRERVLALEKEEKERQEKERQEKERQEIERQEKERQEKERQEKERQEKERQEKERQQKEKAEKERQEKEKQEKERQELEKEKELPQKRELARLKQQVCIYEPCHEKTCFLHLRKEGADQLRSDCALISAFVFATQIVHSFYFTN